MCIYDSAPSTVTHDDITALVAKIGVEPINLWFAKCGRQPRDSVECGVHVIMHAWRRFLGLDPLGEGIILDLGHLRAACAKLAATNPFDRKMAEAIALAPMNVPVASGGGGCEDLVSLRSPYGQVRVELHFQVFGSQRVFRATVVYQI